MTFDGSGSSSGVARGAAVGLVLGVVAVVLLRDATLSTHQPVDPDSRIELVMHVRTHGGEPGRQSKMVSRVTISGVERGSSVAVDDEIDFLVGECHQPGDR